MKSNRTNRQYVLKQQDKKTGAVKVVSRSHDRMVLNADAARMNTLQTTYQYWVETKK